ncbi:MAG: peptidase M16 [Rhodospirillaceae bacterium TMED8]|nr:peptidase M16 [Magnetovibrio sp.]OUT47753.1 MAG: peptidase M16 [Rhodospirillaceae bacterium TMED8]|tara:strand:- start:1538 stop:2872 length:1335 start_codon:yes stop_codon:yes gene_type:complete
MFIRSTFSALILLVLHSLTQVKAKVFNPETFTLQNGMQVVVVNNPRVPVVTHMVWYKVGSADEGVGETGIAHFLEHLMFKGTKSRKPGEFSQIIARHGGQENAFTSRDYTAYYQTIAVDKLGLMMSMEAERMTDLVITPEELEPERQVVIEERLSRVDNNPSAVLREQINASLYLSHPYRTPIIGWRHDIEELKINRILDFYKRFYRPNNAILVVAGDITAKELRPLAEKYYGIIPAGAPVARAPIREPPQKSARRVIHRDKRVRQRSWQRTYIAPSFNWGQREHIYPLEVLANVMGGGGSSRLYRSLVIDHKLAVSAGSYYSGDTNGPGKFTFYASPRDGVSLETLEKAVQEEIKRIFKGEISYNEIKRAKERMQAAAIYARDSLSGGGRILGAALATGIPVDEVEAWPELIGAVTSEQVNNAARETLDLRHSVTGLLLREPG